MRAEWTREGLQSKPRSLLHCRAGIGSLRQTAAGRGLVLHPLLYKHRCLPATGCKARRARCELPCLAVPSFHAGLYIWAAVVLAQVGASPGRIAIRCVRAPSRHRLALPPAQRWHLHTRVGCAALRWGACQLQGRLLQAWRSLQPFIYACVCIISSCNEGSILHACSLPPRESRKRACIRTRPGQRSPHAAWSWLHGPAHAVLRCVALPRGAGSST